MNNHPNQCPACRLAYAECCQPLHSGQANASSPEALMRSRYSAYVLQLYPYIVETYDATQRAQLTSEQIAQSALNTHWLGLMVLNSKILPCKQNSEDQFIGEVEFKVFYSEDKQLYCLHERSDFIQEQGRWVYTTGTFLADNGAYKVKRNDPCICASGKKYKQCCAMIIATPTLLRT